MPGQGVSLPLCLDSPAAGLPAPWANCSVTVLKAETAGHRGGTQARPWGVGVDKCLPPSPRGLCPPAGLQVCGLVVGTTAECFVRSRAMLLSS